MQNITNNILEQYETLQYAVIYFVQTRENNLAVQKMTTNEKKTMIAAFLPKPNLGAHTAHGYSFYLRTPLVECYDFVLSEIGSV